MAPTYGLVLLLLLMVSLMLAILWPMGRLEIGMMVVVFIRTYVCEKIRLIKLSNYF
jgi:hypothetical protein